MSNPFVRKKIEDVIHDHMESYISTDILKIKEIQIIDSATAHRIILDSLRQLTNIENLTSDSLGRVI